MTNPVDLQPHHLLVSLTPAQWRQLFKILVADVSDYADILKLMADAPFHFTKDTIERHKYIHAQLSEAVIQIRLACQAHGVSLSLSKEEEEDD